MFYLWFTLQFAPPIIALWLHSKKSQEVYFTKGTIAKTIGDFIIMSFFINIFLYFVMFMNNPNEIVSFNLINGGKLQEVGFVFKHSVVSLVSSILVGNFYSCSFFSTKNVTS